jgi:hypothetical protein
VPLQLFIDKMLPGMGRAGHITKTMKDKLVRRWLRWNFSLFVSVLISSVGCKPKQAEPPPPEVSVTQPVIKEVTEWDDFYRTA